jgi:hypothetical protein
MKMKPINIISRQLILVLLLIIYFQTAVFPQGDASARRSLSHLIIGLNLTPSQSKINNQVTSSLSKSASSNKTTISGSLELTYLFSKYIGFSTGVGLSSYSTGLSLNSYADSVNLIDSESEAYKHRVKGSGITELQKISFLNVPVLFQMQYLLTHRAGFFMQAGLNIALPMSKTYSSKGTFTYTSYYQSYNVVLKDLPVFGLVSDKSVSNNGSLELKPVSFFASVTAGFQYFISSKLQIGLGFNYGRSLSSISKYPLPDKFEISTDPTLINSMMAGSSKASAQAIGFKISFRYFIR